MEKKVLKNKKGISGVVTTILLIGLVLVSVSILAFFILQIINDQAAKAEACGLVGIEKKVGIWKDNTCYNSTNGTEELRFGINLKDIEVEGVIVSVSFEDGIKSYYITNSEQNNTGLSSYNGSDKNIKLPMKNSAVIYRLDVSNKSIFAYPKPNSISYAPKIKGHQCDASDNLEIIKEC